MSAALLAGHTADVRIATGVVPIGARSPLMLAMSIATAVEQLGDRLVVGLGLGHSEISHHEPTTDGPPSPDDLAARMPALRAALAGGGRGGDLRGVHHQVTPPLLLAALSPAAARRAGVLGDGMVLNWATPAYAGMLVETARAARTEAGLGDQPFTVAAYVPVAVTDDPRPFADQLGRQITAYGQLRSYARELRRAGLAPVSDGSRDGSDAVLGLVEQLGAIGSAEHVDAFLGEFRDAGVDLPIIAPISAAGDAALPSMVATWMALASLS